MPARVNTLLAASCVHMVSVPPVQFINNLQIIADIRYAIAHVNEMLANTFLYSHRASKRIVISSKRGPRPDQAAGFAAAFVAFLAAASRTCFIALQFG